MTLVLSGLSFGKLDMHTFNVMLTSVLIVEILSRPVSKNRFAFHWHNNDI